MMTRFPVLSHRRGIPNTKRDEVFQQAPERDESAADLRARVFGRSAGWWGEWFAVATRFSQLRFSLPSGTASSSLAFPPRQSKRLPHHSPEWKMARVSKRSGTAPGCVVHLRQSLCLSVCTKRQDSELGSRYLVRFRISPEKSRACLKAGSSELPFSDHKLYLFL